nr:hypothetical protein [Tanacetum cinerariifolium]
MKLDQFTQFRLHSLTKEEGWIQIEEYVQYQDDLWDEPSPFMNVSFISEAMQKRHLKRACKQISFLETPTQESNLDLEAKLGTRISVNARNSESWKLGENKGPHEADECEQNNPSEQVRLSGGDIYNDPSLLRFYQNDDTLPWGNRKPMTHMPKGAKVLKDLLSHKEKLEKAASSVRLSEECSVIIQKNVSIKEREPGSFTMPCLIRPLAVKDALAALGASINLMPRSLLQ